MKISKLEIKDFGKFTGSKTIDGIDPRIVLFYGKNEAGKTTIFNLIKAMLYGFYPARADSHPYSSWENGKIEFTAYLNTRGGDEVVVYRKLLSRPQGKYGFGDKYRNLRNETVPEAKHISMEIYDKIYALRVEDLIQIQGQAWEEVEDKLLAGYGTDVIKNTRDVLKNLRDECDSIWRESGRGNFLIKELEGQIKELKRMKKEAQRQEEEIRRADLKIYEIDDEIKKLREEKLNLRALLNKAKELTPVKKVLDQINSLKSKLVKEDISSSLPINIRERIKEVKEQIEEIKSKIKEKSQLIEDKKKEKFNFEPADMLILENKTKINIFSKNYSKIETLKGNIERIRNDIKRLRDRLSHESENVLSKKWNDDIRKEFERINKSELQILVNKYKNIKKELHEVLLKKELQSSATIEIKFSKVYLLGIVFGLILIMVGFFIDSSLVMAAGLGGIIYGLTGVINYKNMKKNYEKHLNKRKESNSLKKKIKDLENKVVECKQDLKNYLKGIPVSDLTIDNIDEMFVPSLIKIKDMVYSLRELEKELDGLRNEYLKEEAELKSFLNQFCIEDYIKEEEYIYILKDRLEDLEKKLFINEGLEKEIIDIQRELTSLKDKQEKLMSKLEEYQDKLKDIGDGDLERGLDIAEENSRIKAKIESLKEELNTISNLDVMVKEIENYSKTDKWIFSEYEVMKAEEKQEEINQKLNEIGIQRARLEESIKSLSESLGIDEIESRLTILEEKLENVRRRRDRLALLSEVIRFADQKFREENQPDVLKNASKYFEIITNGKYTDIFLEQSEEGSNVMVRESGEVMPKRVVDTFSKGTLNQLYLALRLSLIDHLDRDKEALPICFDELLVNWDETRLDNSLGLLNEISKKRQIFIFTCHEWMAEKIERFFRVKRIVLK